MSPGQCAPTLRDGGAELFSADLVSLVLFPAITLNWQEYKVFWFRDCSLGCSLFPRGVVNCYVLKILPLDFPYPLESIFKMIMNVLNQQLIEATCSPGNRCLVSINYLPQSVCLNFAVRIWEVLYFAFKGKDDLNSALIHCTRNIWWASTWCEELSAWASKFYDCSIKW